jgi:hypothetical protein
MHTCEQIPSMILPARSMLLRTLLVVALALPAAALAKNDKGGGKNHVPEFDVAAAGVVAAVVAGGAILLARRRRA